MLWDAKQWQTKYDPLERDWYEKMDKLDWAGLAILVAVAA